GNAQVFGVMWPGPPRAVFRAASSGRLLARVRGGRSDRRGPHWRSTIMSESPTNDQAKKNEGDGNRTADRKYREGVRRHVQSGAPKPAGEEAQHALEGAEA